MQENIQVLTVKIRYTAKLLRIQLTSVLLSFVVRELSQIKGSRFNNSGNVPYVQTFCSRREAILS